MDTVVARATPEDVAREPFPHLILSHAYDDDLCRELLAQFPSPEALGQHDPGGDLEIERFRTRPRGLRGPMVYERFTDVAETVRYCRGNLVLFLNSPRSLHGVTVRSRTSVPR